MPFEIDAQTLNDLEVLQSNDRALVDLYKPVTTGGREMLADAFAAPLNDAIKITERLNTLRYLAALKHPFPFLKADLAYIDEYLRLQEKPAKKSRYVALKTHIKYKISPWREYLVIQTGVQTLLKLIDNLDTYLNQLNADGSATIKRFTETLSTTTGLLKYVPNQANRNDSDVLGAVATNKFDYTFRHSFLSQIRALLNIVYELDFLTAVTQTSQQLNFSYPTILSSGTSKLTIKGLFHPFLKDPIKNDIEFNPAKNILFITGTNMAGKSTLLKSFGICVTLSHLGFPTPCDYMETTVFNGLITTINLADNLNKGYSHFYSEVVRIKNTAQKIKDLGKMVIIFDELFRGTNIKDAYDATLAIITAFASLKNSFFIVSTHLTEVAQEVKLLENVGFHFLETKMVNCRPEFNYKLREGITDERLGYWIIKNEEVIEIIESIREV